MNDSSREGPTPGSAMTAAAAIDCPHCSTQLRLLRPATMHTPIACCICGATFYLQPIETAPLSDSGSLPRSVAGGSKPGLLPLNPVVLRPSDRGPRSPGNAPAAMTSPAPPAPLPGTGAAPGMPKPVELPDHVQRGFRTRWLESVLGAALVLLLVVGACAGGFVLLRAIRTRPTPTQPTADIPPDSESPAVADGRPATESPSAQDAPAPSRLVPAKPLPRPESLTGVWESRLDDGSMSCFIFHANGLAEIIQASDPPQPPSRSNWFLIDKKGDDVVIDIGPEFGQIGNTRLSARFTAPDAFTLARQMKAGVIQPGANNLRYVRTGPVPPEAPPAPPTPPLVGPPAPERIPAKSPENPPAPVP